MLSPELWVPSAELTRTYRGWCDREGIDYPLGRRGLTERLRTRGCKPGKHHGVRGWHGVALLDKQAVVDTSDTLDSRLQ